MTKLSAARYEEVLLETIIDFEENDLGTPEDFGAWLNDATIPDAWCYDFLGRPNRKYFYRRNRAQKLIKSLKNGELVLEHELRLRK